MLAAFWDAIQRPGGAVGRGPRRWYVEVHPQAITGFVDLITHPWVAPMSEAVLGPDYQIVELGFDTPFEGARTSRGTATSHPRPETYEDHRITSLAFNLTGVDVTEDMGPFEIAPGTQWDDGRVWNHEMFPPKDVWPRYAERGVREIPADGRYLVPLRADHPSRHGPSVADLPAGPGAGRRRARRRSLRAPRHDGDPGFHATLPARCGTTWLSGRRRARAGHAEARHRGPGDGRRITNRNPSSGRG